MSYDAVFWALLVFAGCGVGGGCILTGRPLLGATLSGVVAAAFLFKLRWIQPYDWADAAVYPAPGGWAEQHILAAGLFERARWAREMLPWAAPAFLVAAWGAVRSSADRRSLLPLALLLPAGAPSAVLLVWIAAAARANPPDDPSWTLGYVREWRAAGRDTRNGGPCAMFLGVRGGLDGEVAREELEEALRDCRTVCQTQLSQASFNPGSLEGSCRELLD